MHRSKRATVFVLLLSAIAATAGAAGLAPIPDDMIYSGTPDEVYVVGRRENATGTDYISEFKIEAAGRAFDFNGDGYHHRYEQEGFIDPYFSGFRLALFYDCNKDKDPADFGCDNGLANNTAIYMPTPVNFDKPDSCIRTVLGHELFHHIEFAYTEGQGCGGVLGKTVCEGMARMLQDKIYSDADSAKSSGAQCFAGYYNQVNAYLKKPFQNLWEASYDAALFWNYMTEQFGTDDIEPNRGVDFIVKWWTVKDLLDSFDPIEITREALSLYGDGRSLEAAFLDFAIANYAKDLNLDLWSDSARHRWTYVDDNSATPYTSVFRLSGAVAPGNAWAVNILGQQTLYLPPWAAGYFEADVSACPPGSVVRYELDTQGSEFGLHTFMTIRDVASGDPRLQQLWKDSGYGGAVKTVVQPNPRFDTVTGLFATAGDGAFFHADFSCTAEPR